MSDHMRDRIKAQAEAYAYGQSSARNDIGLKARKPNFEWVDEAAFVERALAEQASMIWQFNTLYEQMLAERTHVWRFGPGPDGGLTRQRATKRGGAS